jgi:hypothetical protein
MSLKNIKTSNYNLLMIVLYDRTFLTLKKNQILGVAHDRALSAMCEALGSSPSTRNTHTHTHTHTHTQNELGWASRKGDHKFDGSLGNIVRPCLKKRNQSTISEKRIVKLNKLTFMNTQYIFLFQILFSENFVMDWQPLRHFLVLKVYTSGLVKINLVASELVSRMSWLFEALYHVFHLGISQA